jgi:hypothetical protein
MSWGFRIIILYVAFVAMIGTMVFMTMRQKVDLVADDYYQQELKYQNQIDRQEQSGKLSAQPTVMAGKEAVTITFPEEVRAQGVTGKVNFYRPSDSEKDFAQELAVGADGVQQIPAAKFSTGLYTVKLSWTSGGKDYYNESSVYIP